MSDDAFADRPFEPHVPAFRDESAVLNFTNNLRLQIIQTKTRNGAQLDKLDDDSLKLVLAAANDIDRQIQTSQKIKSEDANADLDRKAGLVIAKYSSMQTTNPFKLEESQVVHREAPSLPDEILNAIEVPEFALETGISQENSEAFMKQFE